jgi:hypothetical protein
MEGSMTIRSCFASLSALAIVSAASTVFAEPPSPEAPPPNWAPPVALRPSAVPYQEGAPVPPGYHVESRVRKGLLWSGSIVFGVSYLLSLGPVSNPGGEWVFVPIAGPALYASHRKCEECVDDIATPIYVMTFTAGQVVGATLLASAFLAQKQWLVADEPYAAAPRPTLTVLPSVDRTSASVVAVGAF